MAQRKTARKATTRRRTARKSTARKSGRPWSAAATRNRDALDLSGGVFTGKDPKRIAHVGTPEGGGSGW